MLYEDSSYAEHRPASPVGPDRIVDGWVHGRHDCWVVVAPREDVWIDWLGAEVRGRDAIRPRVCTTICEDGSLVIEDAVTDIDDPFGPHIEDEL